LLHSRRADGVSRHVQVARLPSIRGCCIADRRARGSWWAAVLAELQELERRGILGNPDGDPRFKTIVAALHERVDYAPPSAARFSKARWVAKKAATVERPVTVSEVFALLGVSPSCSAEELKRAWRKAAVAHHPDRGGASESFRRITEAYEMCRRLRAFD
jgi:hypothetical protein